MVAKSITSVQVNIQQPGFVIFQLINGVLSISSKSYQQLSPGISSGEKEESEYGTGWITHLGKEKNTKKG
jgi:hypothetical protein